MKIYRGDESSMPDVSFVKIKKNVKMNIGDSVLLEVGDKIYPKGKCPEKARGYIVKKGARIPGTDVVLEKGDVIVSCDSRKKKAR